MNNAASAMEQNARNMRDFLELYNKLTEMCFHRCVSNFNNRGLTNDEMDRCHIATVISADTDKPAHPCHLDSCVTGCVDRYVKFNQRLMMTYMEFQNAKQDAAIKEMEQAIAEGRTPNVPGIAQEMAARAGEGAMLPQGATTETVATNTLNESPKS